MELSLKVNDAVSRRSCGAIASRRLFVLERGEGQPGEDAAHHEGAHVLDPVVQVVEGDALGDLIVVGGEPEGADDPVIAETAKHLAGVGLGDRRHRDGQPREVDRGGGRDGADIVAHIGAEAFEIEARDVRRLEVEPEQLDEAEVRREPAHVGRRRGRARGDERGERVIAAEGDAAEGETVELDGALALDDALDAFDAELAEAVDREVVEMEVPDHQMVDAHCLDRGIEDGEAADGEGREHRRQGAHRQPLGEGVRHVGMDHHLVEEVDEAHRRLAKPEVLEDDGADVELRARHVHDDVVVGGVGHAVPPHHVAGAVHVGLGVIDVDEGAEVGVAALDAADRHVDQAVGRRRLHPDRSGGEGRDLAVGEALRCGSSRRRPCW